MDIEHSSVMLIANSGNARSLSFEGLRLAKKGDIKGAKEKLEEATQSLQEAHKIQTELIQKEAAGESIPPSVLLIHSQDHLMTSMLAKDLIIEMVDMIESKVS